MKKNRIRICGRKTITLPAPAMTPSTSRLRSGPSAMCAVVQSPRPAIAALIASIGTAAQENTAWNIRNRTTASSARPQTGCITTASMRCWKRCSCRRAAARRAARMRRTSRCRSADERAAPARGSSAARRALRRGTCAELALSSASRRRGRRARPRPSRRPGSRARREPRRRRSPGLRRGRRRPC